MDRRPYSAGAVKFSFWFPEFQKEVGLLADGKLLLYRVKSGQMQRDGYTFYRSVNGVWLTKSVPAEYLEKLE